MRNQIFNHDGKKAPWPVSEASVDCIVTSPPYWGLRDYGTATWVGGSENCDHVEKSIVIRGKPSLVFHGSTAAPPTIQFRGTCGKCGARQTDEQIGQEETPELYVENICLVMDECWRILKPGGTLWLNLGDTYWGGKGQSGGTAPDKLRGGTQYQSNLKGACRPQDRRHADIKPKDLVGIPWMVAFALRARGWYLRSEIIWNKPNPMPESVTDRPTRSHEQIFLLTKRKDYYYDAEAIKTQAAGGREKFSGGKYGKGLDQSRNDTKSVNEEIAQTRNKRDVWTVTTQPYSEAHFATFPPELIRPCIKAGTSAKGNCGACGEPWERITESKRIRRDELPRNDPRFRPNQYKGEYDTINGKGDAGYNETVTIGWRPTCTCGTTETVRPIVFDPFAGAGTTMLVAQEENCDWSGLELNPDYIQLIYNRIKSTQTAIRF